MDNTSSFYPKYFLSSWTWPRAAQNSFAGRMRPAGRVFETPGVKQRFGVCPFVCPSVPSFFSNVNAVTD